jgi:hypothetical protein
VGDPFEKSGKKDDIWGSTNSMYSYSLPKSLLSWDSTNKVSASSSKGSCVIYIQICTKQIDSMLKNTNKQTDVHGRTE